MLALLACSTGILAGFLAGLFGVGGGIIVVPALYHLFIAMGCSGETAMSMAVSTSLLCIIPTSISSIKAHWRLNNIAWYCLRFWSPALFLGALIGALGVSNLRGSWLQGIFAALLGIVAIIIVVRLVVVFSTERDTKEQRGGWGMLLSTFCIGCVSALAGVGGGALGGPLLVVRGFSAHRAVGTAAGFGFLIALPAVLLILVLGSTRPDAPYGSFSLINFPAFLLIVSASVLTAPFGAKFGKRLSHRMLSGILALLLVLLVIKMLIEITG